MTTTQEIEVVKGRRPWLTALLVFTATLALGVLFVNLASSRRHESARHQALDLATQRARAIEGETQRIASALYPIAAILGQRGKADSLESLAPLLVVEPLNVVGVAVAPDGVVSELGPLSPMVETNQDLRVDPRVGPAVNAALSASELTMAGPFSAGRLGAGVALCLPLGAARDELGRPWGVLLATVAVHDLLRAGKAELLVSSGLDYHLTSLAESGRPLVLARSTENDLPDPVTAEVRVPNGVWTLAVAPAAGWDNTRQTGSQLALAFAAALAAALSMLRLAREPDQLRAEVEKRRRRLASTRKMLEVESEKRLAVEELRQLEARHDKLTGLQSRAYFVEQVQRAVDRVPFEPESSFAVLFVDIDHFQRVNDTLGPAVGDLILVELARRVEQGLRLPGDAVARVGGDQFAALLWNVHGEGNAEAACERLLSDIRKPYAAASQEIRIGASAGLVVASTEHERGDDIIRDADLAMRVARSRGRGGWALFEPGMRQRALTLQRLEIDLRHAVEHEEFEPFYQPIVSLADGALIGAEALVRWRHPERGIVPPFEFIAFAEASDLIVSIDRLVIRAACLQAREWQREFPAHRDFSMSVNLSARQLSQPGLVEFVAEALATSGLGAKSLKLEVTESGVMEDPEAAREVLNRLKVLGAQILIDDFGTGYSSLGYLERFAFDIVKIDQTFVRNMEASPKNREIIKAVVDLARGLDLEVLAEGVETAAHFAAVRQMGCQFAQGYFLSKPVPASAFRDLLATHPPWLLSGAAGMPPAT